MLKYSGISNLGSSLRHQLLDQINKSHIVPVPYPTMYNSEQKCVHFYTFLFWMVHCGIWDRCTVGFVRLVYSTASMALSLLDKRILVFHKEGFRLFLSFWGPWWRHQMEIFSALLAICAGNSPVPVNSPHKSHWRGALMFSLICAWINGWVNNREAGNLRRYRAHYDVTVMRDME